MKAIYEKLGQLANAFEEEDLRPEIEISLPSWQLRTLFEEGPMRNLFVFAKKSERSSLRGTIQFGRLEIKFLEKEGA